MDKSGSNSNSHSPNTKKRLRLKLTLNRNKADTKTMDKEDTQSVQSDHISQSLSQSLSPPLYTYSSWLDDVVSDTECKYLSRNRLMPAKINHVQYIFEIQTSVGLDTFHPEDGNIKPSDACNQDKDNAMDIDDEDQDQDDDLKMEDTNGKEWFTKSNIGDNVQCYNEEEDVWSDNKIMFINRRFDLQYCIRKSMNTESIYEYDRKTQFPNHVLREKCGHPYPLRFTAPVSVSSSVSTPKRTSTTDVDRYV
eukprot:TRINITY_DN1631_c0_g1_i1.p1 TRINITY_DN1631_c0_g1~~TRINITY_DN1631_c0_g1_i1.p1  ORF type:complete len:250 (-),score=79.28 TRINITY_DN1631_c0_g1_i1:23-772(-)